MAIRIDVVVGVIDRGDEKSHFIPFVGMLVGSCFKGYMRPHIIVICVSLFVMLVIYAVSLLSVYNHSY